MRRTGMLTAVAHKMPPFEKGVPLSSAGPQTQGALQSRTARAETGWVDVQVAVQVGRDNATARINSF